MANTAFEFMFYFVKLRSKYERIESDRQKREVSVYFGVMSLINSVIWAMLVVLGAVGLGFSIEFLGSSFIIGIVMVIFCGALAVVSLVYLAFGSSMCFVYQLKLNKHPIGYIAIGVWVLCIAASVVLTVFFSNGF